MFPNNLYRIVNPIRVDKTQERRYYGGALELNCFYLLLINSLNSLLLSGIVNASPTVAKFCLSLTLL